MAFFDWNQNEKSDWQDNYIEMNILNEDGGDDEDEPEPAGRSAGGGQLSCLGLIGIVVIGLFAAVELEVKWTDAAEIDELPLPVFLLLWGAAVYVAVRVLYKDGKKK